MRSFPLTHECLFAYLEGDVDFTARWNQVEPVSDKPPALMNATLVTYNEWELIL